MDSISEKIILSFHLERENRISYCDNNKKYIMTLTRQEKEKIYFGCLARHHKNKCSATGIYEINNKSFKLRHEYIPGCGENLSINYEMEGFKFIEKTTPALRDIPECKGMRIMGHQKVFEQPMRDG